MPGLRTRMDNSYREMDLSEKAGVLARPRASATIGKETKRTEELEEAG